MGSLSYVIIREPVNKLMHMVSLHHSNPLILHMYSCSPESITHTNFCTNVLFHQRAGFACSVPDGTWTTAAGNKVAVLTIFGIVLNADVSAYGTGVNGFSNYHVWERARERIVKSCSTLERQRESVQTKAWVEWDSCVSRPVLRGDPTWSGANRFTNPGGWSNAHLSKE